MSNLEKIQKAMKVFQVLTMIVMVFAFLGGAFTLIGGSVVLMSDQLPFSDFLQKLLIQSTNISNNQLGVIILSESVPLTLGAVLSIFVYRYFKLELSEGTPFTETGAKRIAQLGIIFIAADILTSLFSSVMEEFFPFMSGQIDNVGGIKLGICLVLLSVIACYGAELEQKSRTE